MSEVELGEGHTDLPDRGAAGVGGAGAAARRRTGGTGSRAADARVGERGDGRAADLERRYRRLLVWYPRDHRSEHAEEMLGVLMAGAAGGRTRPGARDSVNLVGGALQIRLRRAVGWFGNPRWRDALAVTSVLAPLLAFTLSLESIHLVQLQLAFWQPGQLLLPDVLALLVPVMWLVVVVLALVRRRRTAVVAVAATTAAHMLWSLWISVWWVGLSLPEVVFLGALTVVALLRSDGPRRGLEILGRRRAALIAVGVLIWAAEHLFAKISAIVPGFPDSGLLTRSATLVSLVVLIPVAVACLRNPVGRRALLLTVPVATPQGAFYVAWHLTEPSSGASHPAAVALLWIVYLALSVAVAVLAITARPAPGGAGPVVTDPGAAGLA